MVSPNAMVTWRLSVTIRFGCPRSDSSACRDLDWCIGPRRRRPFHHPNPASHPPILSTVLRAPEPRKVAVSPPFIHPCIYPSIHPVSTLHLPIHALILRVVLICSPPSPWYRSAATLMSCMSAPTGVPPTIAPGEPAFIRRLPEGVEYTHIKALFMDLPSPLTTLLWSMPSQNHFLVEAFKGRTVRAIDRALRREKNARTNRQTSTIRHELVSLCLHEANGPSSPHPGRRISVTQVFPQLFAEEHRPPGPSVQHVRITVTSSEPQRPRSKRAISAPTVLEERIIVTEPADWDPAIPFIDPGTVDRVVLELLRKHFPRLMGIRVGARWRSNYAP